MKLIPSTVLITLVVMVFPLSVLAHVTGASWEKVVNGDKIDIGYDPTTFTAGQTQRFDFNVFDTSSGKQITFSDVWVRISLDQNTVFASGIHNPTYGTPGMLFTFPKAGEYVLDARFENNDENIAETTIPITVSSESIIDVNKKPSTIIFVIVAIIGLLFGAIIDYIMRRKK